MKILIYDISITGHHSEYISHLIDYLFNKNDNNTTYYFVVHPDFSTQFHQIYEKAKKVDFLRWHTITQSELSTIKSKGNVWISLMGMKVMDKYAKQYEVDHVIALDYHFIKYGSMFYKPAYTISSILFLQFHRMELKSWSQKYEYIKRYLFTKWSVANKQITRIFILNDEATVEYMNKKFNTNSFHQLPDPIPNLQPLEQFDIYKHYQIELNRKIFLHIGALGDRKGTQEVVESALYLDQTIQKKTMILLVGKVGNKADEKLLKKKIQRIKTETQVQIFWDNQFVPLNMMKSLFDQCDTVLLPYKNAEYSSGILGHAAASNKRVIATNAGLIKVLVSQYELGALLNEPNAKNLAKKMMEIFHKPFQSSNQNKFVSEHQPDVFAKMVLNSGNNVINNN